MAGLSAPGQMLPSGGGLFGPLARAQYLALLKLRWRIFVNGLRSRIGAFEFSARAVSYVIYSIFGLGLGFGAGATAYALASDDKWQYFPLVFWFVFFLWQVVPIMLASFQEQFDLGTMLRFPVSFSSYYFLYVVFGLSDLSTIIGALCSIGIWLGVALARPDLMAWTAAGLLVFAAFNILLVRAIFSWIDRWLSQRKTREILAALFMLFFLSFQLMNPAVWQHGRRGPAGRIKRGQEIQNVLDQSWVRTANSIQKELPPGLAASALREAAGRQPAQALGSFAILALFTLAAGGVLGWRLRSEYSGENLDSAPPRVKRALNAGRTILGNGSRERLVQSLPAQSLPAQSLVQSSSLVSSGISNPIMPIIEKEFRSLLRTLPLLYAVGAPLLMVLIISGSFLRAGPRLHTSVFAFPLCVFFAQLGFHQLLSNNLGADGPGIQLYFLSPTPIRTVLLAKNLFHSLIYFVTLVLAAILATLRLGEPTMVIAAVTAAWLLFVLPCNLAAGNIFSLTMPYRINPGRISRQRRSQGSALSSLLIELAELAVGVVVFEACSAAGAPWLAIPIFLVLTAIAIYVWLRVLSNSGDIAGGRKDQVIATLMKTD